MKIVLDATKELTEEDKCREKPKMVATIGAKRNRRGWNVDASG